MQGQKLRQLMNASLTVILLSLTLASSVGAAEYEVLYKFKHGTDGASPYAGLIFDAAGNLYGTTQDGGAHNKGIVFKLTSNPDGTWTESKLHTFRDTDGTYPSSGLIFDAAGNLYGTTVEGGDLSCNPPLGCGVVFKLTP